MAPFGMMFSGLGGGSCNTSFPVNAYAAITRNATMQMMFSNIFGMGFGGYGMMPGVATAPYAQQATTTAGGSSSAPTVTKEQVNDAEKAYFDLDTLCNKTIAYKDDTTTKREDLKKAADDKATNTSNVQKAAFELEKQHTKILEDINALQAKIDDPANKNDLNNLRVQMQALQKQEHTKKLEIEAKEKELQQAKDEELKSLMDLEAYDAGKEKSQEQYNKMRADRQAAYENYVKLHKAYKEQLAQKDSENAVRQDRAQDKEHTGSWWKRSKLNPKNWTNLNFKGEKDNSANVAKCLRKLQNKGRADAIEYGLKKGLITKDANGVLHTTHSELKGLCGLHNGRDKIVDQY